MAIDVAVMESGIGSVLPLDAGWSDVGMERRTEQEMPRAMCCRARDRGRQPRLLSAQRTPPGGGAGGREPGGGGNRRCRFDCGPLGTQEVKTVVKQLEAEAAGGQGPPPSTGHGLLHGVVEDSRWRVRSR